MWLGVLNRVLEPAYFTFLGGATKQALHIFLKILDAVLR